MRSSLVGVPSVPQVRMLRVLTARRPGGLRPFRCAVPTRSFYGRPSEATAARVRSAFIDYFRREHGHRFVPSSPVRPRGDPSLLFVNAGMNQFKPLLLGRADPRSDMASFRRVVNSQKCVRAGGKHNDLEDVGRDLRHHTFFEMLGSWSFGDYFKEEACSMAWSFLTQVLEIPAASLVVSYFGGDAASGLAADRETRRIWLDLGVPPGRLLALGPEENFWEMGDTGPCGPCTEIHYRHPSGDLLEIWNLVFMQYNRQSDGVLQPLPLQSVDTGLGLERLLSVLQGKPSNYDTDLFAPLLLAIRERSKASAYGGRTGAADVRREDMAYRVVADHVRALTVCIADGIHPGMSGAELVVRRILRRAVRFSAEVLKAPQGTLGDLVPAVLLSLGDAYPELHQEAARVTEVINQSEDHFLSSLRRGSRLIQRTLARMDDKHGLFPASVAWSLHRDLGFPLDLVDLVLEERGVQVDRQTLQQLMADSQRAAQRRGGGGGGEEEGEGAALDVLTLAELRRLGIQPTDDGPKYEYRLDRGRYEFPACRAQIVALHDGGALVRRVGEGRRCGVLLDRTCFYAEQGGQSHDRGYFIRDGLQDVPFPVEAAALAGGYVVHQVTAAGDLEVGDRVELHLDQARRLACMAKHTATHLLSWALRRVLGPSPRQHGSHVGPDRLRFDCGFQGTLSDQQLREVERRVNEVVSANRTVHSQEVPLATARSIGGLRTVDELYPDPVRVVSVGVPVSELLEDPTDRRTSVELCCGTHLLRTGAIQDLAIVSERQLVRGVSRIIAVTGRDATRAREEAELLTQEVDSLAVRLSGSAPSSLDSAQRLAKEVGVVSDAVDQTSIPQWRRRDLQRRLKALQRSSNTAVRKMEAQEAAVWTGTLLRRHEGRDLVVDAIRADSDAVVMKAVNRLSAAAPRSHVMLFGTAAGGRVVFACQVPKEAPLLSASDWAGAVSRRLGGGAGGSPLVARGTGTCDDITAALRWAELFVRGMDDDASQTGTTSSEQK